jgi:hypothetical protein
MGQRVTAPQPEGRGLPASDMGSSNECVQSHTEDLLGRIGVPVVNGTAFRTLPHPLIQACAAFRPSNASAS